MVGQLSIVEDLADLQTTDDALENVFNEVGVKVGPVHYLKPYILPFVVKRKPSRQDATVAQNTP